MRAAPVFIATYPLTPALASGCCLSAHTVRQPSRELPPEPAGVLMP